MHYLSHSTTGMCHRRRIAKLMVELARPRPRIVRLVRQTFEGGTVCLLIGFGRGRRSGISLLFMVLSPAPWSTSRLLRVCG